MFKAITDKQGSILGIGIAAFFAASAAYAGGDIGNGGNTVTCKGKPTVLLDYYQATLKTKSQPGGPDLIEIENARPGEVLAEIEGRLKLAAPNFAQQYSAALSDLGPIDGWKETDLRDAKDAGEAYFLPSGCKKGQVAIRQQQTMFVDPRELTKLSAGQQDLLRAHEAIYFLAEKAGFEKSDQVRVVIAQLLSAKMSVEGVQKALRGMKMNPYFHEQLEGVTYTFRDNYCDVRFYGVDAGSNRISMREVDGQGCGRDRAELECAWDENDLWAAEKMGFHTSCRFVSNQYPADARIFFSSNGKRMRLLSKDAGDTLTYREYFLGAHGYSTGKFRFDVSVH